MNKDTLKEFANLKIEANKIEERLAELKPIVLAEIVGASLDKVPTSLGTFSIKKKKNWVYSEKVESIIARLKLTKEIEEADGTATFTETPILEFRENKE